MQHLNLTSIHLHCTDCSFECDTFTKLDQHIAAKHSRPNHEPVCNTLMIGDSLMKSMKPRVVEKAVGGRLFTPGYSRLTAPLKTGPTPATRTTASRTRSLSCSVRGSIQISSYRLRAMISVIFKTLWISHNSMTLPVNSPLTP